MADHRWRIRIRFHADRHQYRYMPAETPEAAARLAGRQWCAVLAGETAGLGPDMRFAAWIMRCEAAEHHLRARSREVYAGLRRHMAYLLPYRLDAIRAADAARLADHLAGAGVPPATIRAVHQRTHSLLREAVRLGIIPADPWQALRAPRAPRAPAPVPAVGGFLALSEAATGRAGLLLRLAFATGARRGEILALRWGDIDLAAGAVAIAHNLAELADGSLSLQPPKTRAGLRTITVAGAILAELGRERLAAAPRALSAGRPLAELPIVPAADGVSYWSPRAASMAAGRAMRRAGVAGHLHSVRHLHCSVLLSAGASLAGVAARAGHGSAGVTASVYSHAMPRDDAGCAAIVAGFDRPARARVA
jgi:integrase